MRRALDLSQTLRQEPVTVVTGRIERIDAVRRLISLGSTTIRVPDAVSLTGCESGKSVTVTYEERAGERWAVGISRVRL